MNRVKTPRTIVHPRTKKLLTDHRYLHLFDRMRVPHDCEHDHFECAAWPKGPCADEVRSRTEDRPDETG